MRDQAERWGAVLIAPLFQKQFYGRYQQLEDSESGARADLALLDIVADIRGIAGIAVAPFFLTGFSGGAQFAHRFALYHADQVASCVSCSAGWYSFPDQDRCYPHGLARCSGPGGMSLHTDWLSVAHHVVVGRRDNNIVENLNMSREVVDQQGVGRLRRARRWTRAMNEVLRASSLGKINLTLIDGLSHDYSMATRRFDLGRTIFKKFLMDGLSGSHRHAP
jgi:pimeloyl-ACP methyl ester carboxylesterase